MGFLRPVAESPFAVERIGEVVVSLPDPLRVPAAGSTGYPRHAGARLVVGELRSRTASQSLTLRAPARAAGRFVRLAHDGDPDPLPGGPRFALALESIPFPLAPTLRGLARGLPTFYLTWDGPPPSEAELADERLVARGEVLASILPPDSIYVGVLFQDGVTLWPWQWIEEIRQATEAAGEDAAEWLEMETVYQEVPRSYRVLDHVGAPLAGQSFEVREQDNAASSINVTAGADADLEAAVASTAIATLFPATGDPDREIRWTSALSIQADARSGIGSAPGLWLPVPRHASARGAVHVLDLDAWLSVPPPGSSIERYRTGNRFEPIVDGNPFFRMFLDDLRNARPPVGGAAGTFGGHFGGFGFNDYELVPGDAGSRLSTVLADLLQPGPAGEAGSFRFLTTKILQVDESVLVTRAFLVWLAIALGVVFARSEVSNPTAWGMVAAGVAVGVALTIWLKLTLNTDPELGLPQLEDLSFIDTVNGLLAGTGVIAYNPVSMAANPLADLPSALTSLVDHFGIYHQKFQVIRRQPRPDEGVEHVGYVGGMDLKKSRLAAPGHQTGDDRWHDVQARITGPAVRDLFLTFAERWHVDRASNGQAGLPIEIPTPTEPIIDAERRPAEHIVQIGRTYHRPAAPGTGLPFAVDGEQTIHDTLLRAIGQARRYIHIEDQYFTPNDVPDDMTGGPAYFNVLLDAADHCDRLFVMSPARTDQPFGAERRRSLLGRLLERWGPRAQVCAPLRRPMLPEAGPVASRYRCRTFAEVLAGQTTGLVVGPRNRLPGDPGFWMWINGELMAVTSMADGGQVDGVSVALVDVARSGITTLARWGASNRAHAKGAPVTLAGLPGIFVHAKLMIVDDLFVSIGTANLNRRGFFHDGEINAFCVPQGLRGAADNPALELRCALMAEHLGIPPEMGRSLFADPVAAFELFRRSRYLGNRSVPMLDVDVEPLFPLALEDHPFARWLSLIELLAFGAVEGLAYDLWDTVIDPTTRADLAPPHVPF